MSEIQCGLTGTEVHGFRGQTISLAGSSETLLNILSVDRLALSQSPTIELNGPQITQLFLYTSLPWQTKGLLLEGLRP